jgi:hypothetical protein
MAMDEMPPDTGNNGGGDLPDKIHQLLDGKLEPADVEALIALVMGDEQDVPAKQPPNIAQDRMIRRAVAQSAKAHARADAEQRSDLMKRFPALQNARVV